MLRMELGPLRAHKYKYNFIDTSDPLCIVCKKIENTSHYLLHCKSFRLARVSLLQDVSIILKFDISALPERKIVSILLYGKDDIDTETNHTILRLVTSFI